MNTYELTTGTRDDFEANKTMLISDFIQQITGVVVTNQLLGTGKIVSCYNACNTIESLIFTVHFDLDETKNYGAAVALSSGSLKFVDASLDNVWDDFAATYTKLKSAYSKASDEARRLEKEAQKKAEQQKKAAAKYEQHKAKAIRDFDELTKKEKTKVTAADEFYYALGWLAAHTGTVSANLPDYLEEAFFKHFGAGTPCHVVDSSKRGPAGWQSQWSWSFKITLRKADSIPAMLHQYLNEAGTAVSKTAFIWDLVSDYGFKFGKKQDIVEILRCVPIEHVPMFNDGLKA